MIRKYKKTPPEDLFVGARVRITGRTHKDITLVGMYGTIENISYYPDSIGVRVDGKTNSASSDGIYWIVEDKLQIIKNNESENTNMIKEKYKIMMNEHFVVAGVKFIEGTNTDKEYYYALFDYENVDIGSLVLVQSAHHGMGLARISSIGKVDKNAVTDIREIISVIDTSAFDARVKTREEMIALKAKMDKAIKELQEMAIYETFAKENTELAGWLSCYKILAGGANDK